MIDFRVMILTIAAAAAFLVSTLVNPTFAASTAQAESFSGDGSFLNFGEDFPFGNVNFNHFFGNFFTRRLNADMDGAEEIPGPGDSDGRGESKVRIKPRDNELCVDIEVKYIDQATAAHIHHAPKGSAGAVVVSLPIPNGEGEAEGCVSVDSALLEKIKNNPQDYYINVHNNSYPNGAIRGQLSK